MPHTKCLVELSHFVAKIEYSLKRRNFLSQKETYCHRKKLQAAKGRNFLSQEETSSHKKKVPVTGRNFLSLDETSYHRKKPPVTVRNLLSQEETSWRWRWRLLKMFLCFKMLTKYLKML
jgi:hypothetical protein